MSTNFAQLGTPQPIVDVLRKAGVTEPFPVQVAAIPDALAGRDIAGKAPTGSGKTLAFGIPLASRVERGTRGRPRGLVLAPTRELAEQITVAVTPIARAMKRTVAAVYGGVGYGPQRTALRRGVDVLVATPGRLEDLIAQGDIDLSDVDMVVVDEADRMADMGFLPAVRRILDLTSPDRQTLLFSATLDGAVAVLTRHYQNDPVRHEAVTLEADLGKAAHHFWLVDRNDRVTHTVDLVERSGRAIVFTRTRRGADRLAKQMSKEGVAGAAIHGGLSQGQRNRALKSFSSGRASALIATDVAARGIHIDDVATVVHYDLPADSKDYLHRSGRTARAGASGSVFSLITHDQRRAVQRMQRELDLDAPITKPGANPVVTDRARPSRHATQPTTGMSRDEVLSGSIFVNNLPWSATAEDLERVFEPHGKVVGASVATDSRGRSRGFGFVEMDTTSTGDAIRAVHGSSLGGRQIKVTAARPPSRKG